MINSSLTSMGRNQLAAARTVANGRSSHAVYGGHERVLHQALIALAAGHQLGEHTNPGEATVHVLQGRVRLTAGDVEWDGAAGHPIEVPDARHTLEAIEDSGVLLTIVNTHRAGSPSPTSSS